MFYIVSRGSTATHWVAKNLSKHQDIVCFFASRSFPPLEPGKAFPSNKETWVQEPLDASKYLDSLIMCENATHGSKVFGSIHGYHNLEMKNLVEQKGGVFRYMVRHPLEQVHSAFIYYCNKLFKKNNKNIPNQDIHNYICDKLKNFKINKNLLIKKTYKPHFLRKDLGEEKFLQIKRFKIFAISNLKKLTSNRGFLQRLSSESEENQIVNIFSRMALDFLFIQNLYFQNWGEKNALKMEKIFSDKNYFKFIINALSPNSKVDDSFIETIYSSNKERVNIHREKPINNDQIFHELPNCLKEIFDFHFQNNQMNKYCDKFEYKIDF